MAVYAFGSGEPILLMPGPHRLESQNDFMADTLITGLVALRRRVITFAPPPVGRSTRKAKRDILEMHGCATQALEACGVHGAVDALGHSMGGLALLAYAIEHPVRLRRIVLVGTGAGGAAYMESEGAIWNSTHPKFQTMAGLGTLHMVLPNRATQKMMTNLIRRESYLNKRLATDEAIGLRDWFRRREGRTDWHIVASRLDYSERLGEVTAPTLVVCGRYDPQFPPPASEQLADGLRNARLVVMERSGHYPFIEEPDRFWAVVSDFLAPSGAESGR
jgi:proline iminopeptidase